MELGGQLGPYIQQIYPSIQFKNKTLEAYSHPHSTPHIVPMGNHRLGHHHTRVNSISPRVLKTIIVIFRKQLARTRVIQSFNVIITTIGVETVVAPNTNVVKDGVLIGFVANLGSGLGGILVGRNLSQSSILPIVTIGVVGTPQMVFTNLIMTTHVNRIVDQPSMN